MTGKATFCVGKLDLCRQFSDNEGFMSVGTSGWHVDGVMLKAPTLCRS